MLEKALITHGSPTLARLKTGSLFAVPSTDPTALRREIAHANSVLNPRGVVVTPMREAQSRTLLYLYREHALNETLHQPEIQSFLSLYGYSEFTLPAALATLRARLSAADGFPHEIGVFLGYPLADVLGFIQNKGRHCLCSGCWKAYANPHEAQRTFARLHKCKAVYARLYAEGRPLARLTVKSP